MGASQVDQIAHLFEHSILGETQVNRNIAVTSLVNPDTERYGDILAMDLAMEMKQLDVKETGNVPHLIFEAQSPTLIRCGEAVLGGGKQDRIVRKSAIVDGSNSVDVFCIEAGRWTPKNQSWVRIDTPVSLRQMVLSGANQRQVWQKVQSILSQWKVASQTNALGAMYEILKGEFQRRVMDFRLVDNQAGMIVTIDGVVRGLEFFGDRMLFSRDAKGILANSYVPEAKMNVSGHMSREVIDSAIEEFIHEMHHGKKSTDVLHYNDKLVYACAV